MKNCSSIEWNCNDPHIYQTNQRPTEPENLKREQHPVKVQNSPKGRYNPPSEHLYQINPWPTERKDIYRQYTNYSSTSSLESYGNWARKESYCLFNNGRRANFTLQLNLQRAYCVSDILKLRKELNQLFAYLRRTKNFAAYAVLEITRDKYKKKPTDKIHTHFLIETALTVAELKDLFRRACEAAKYTPDDYEISKIENITGMRDGEYKHRICNYITKDGFPKKVIMFKPNLGFRKTRKVGKFWMDKNGKPTNKEKIWAKAQKGKRN